MKHIVALLLLFVCVFSQGSLYGLTFSGLLTNFAGKQASKYSYKPNLSVSVYRIQNFQKFDLSYELQLSITGANYSKTIDFYGNKNVNFSENLLFFEFPIQLHYKLKPKTSIVAGISFGAKLTVWSSDDPYYTVIPEAINTQTNEITPFQLSVEMGVKHSFYGYDFLISYSESITNITNYSEIDFRSSVIRFKFYYPL